MGMGASSPSPSTTTTQTPSTTATTSPTPSTTTSPSTQHTPDMQLLVLLGLAATATALPAYVHEEIPAEPYVHIEPPIDDLTLGIIRPNQQQQQYQQPQAQQPAGYANGPWAGRCVNNKGEGVECRRKF